MIVCSCSLWNEDKMKTKNHATFTCEDKQWQPVLVVCKTWLTLLFWRSCSEGVFKLLLTQQLWNALLILELDNNVPEGRRLGGLRVGRSVETLLDRWFGARTMDVLSWKIRSCARSVLELSNQSMATFKWGEGDIFSNTRVQCCSLASSNQKIRMPKRKSCIKASL